MPASDAIETFKVAAQSYIELLDSVEAQARDEFLFGVSRALTTLFRAALDLPDLWDDDWQFKGEYGPSERAQKRLVAQLRHAMGEDDLYLTVVAYGQHAGKELGGSVSDDLADIYVEISTGLTLLDRGGSPGEAAWVWRFGFWGHWGEHAVDALRVLYALIAEDLGGTTLIAGGGH